MKPRHWERSVSGVLLLAILLLILAACGVPAPGGASPSPAASPSPEAGGAPAAPAGANAVPGVLRINTGNEPENVDPQKASFVDELQFIMMAYQPLMTFDLEMNAIPGAAERVEVSEDGKTYTFKLPAGAQYSDGSPLTAHNFEYAWKRLADPETAGEYQALPCGVIKGYSEYSAAACLGEELDDVLAKDNLEQLRDELGVRAIDDTTLEIELEHPAPYFPAMAALWIGAPVREEDVEKGEDWWYEPANYIGNGPFILSEWEHDTKAIWKPNPNWQLGPIKLQGVEYHMIQESQVAFQAYQNGELDMLGVAPEDLGAVQGNPQLSQELIDVPGSCTFYFGFNTTKAPFDNIKVRQAFAQAFDREAWARDVFQGLTVPAYSFIPPDFPGHLETDQWSFNPDVAKQALADAGFADGQGLPEIKLTFSQSARNQVRFEWVANQLRENLDINAVLDPVDPTAYFGLLKRLETTPQMFYLGWCADYPDPQNWISIWQTGGILQESSGWSNARLDELTKQADVAPAGEERMKLYDEAHQILIEEAPVVFMNHEASKGLIKPYVQGVTADTITPLDYWAGFFNLQEVDVQP